MKVCGFTFIRNAIKFDYPVVEAIQSVLPLCDHFIVAVGNSEDDTLNLIRQIDSDKIEIVESIWNDALREGGRVLADETNKVFDRIPSEYDWCFYIQADECVHEKFLPEIKKSMEDHLHDPRTEGLLFHYKHFYGSYDFTADSRRWYRNEIRIIRNDKHIRSYKDAQGFRKDGRKLQVKRVNASIYHYGWVRPPAIMKSKDLSFNRMYHSDEWINEVKKPEISEFDYSEIDSLKAFTEEHPAVIQKRIHSMNWKFNFDPSRKKFHLKNRLSDWIEKITGWRMFEYKNYQLIK